MKNNETSAGAERILENGESIATEGNLDINGNMVKYTLTPRAELLSLLGRSKEEIPTEDIEKMILFKGVATIDLDGNESVMYVSIAPYLMEESQEKARIDFLKYQFGMQLCLLLNKPETK